MGIPRIIWEQAPQAFSASLLQVKTDKAARRNKEVAGERVGIQRDSEKGDDTMRD